MKFSLLETDTTLNEFKVIEEIKKFIENDDESFLYLVKKEFIIGDNQLKRRTVRHRIGKDWWSTPWGFIILDPRIKEYGY